MYWATEWKNAVMYSVVIHSFIWSDWMDTHSIFKIYGKKEDMYQYVWGLMTISRVSKL